MCGIAGIIKLNNKISDLKYQIICMSHTVKHRGPDDEGYLLISNNNYFVSGGKDTLKKNYNTNFLYSPKYNIEDLNSNFNIALGHRRLSILDLSTAGHQPMCSVDGKIWIIHNGEIYNYIELRNQLKSYGYSFISNTDTEVILKAYEKWGKDCVKRFNGMWAFVILDLRKKILFCSRDRFGVKPFYYYDDGNYFAFGSEIKSLLTLPFVSKDVDNAMIYNYLLWGETESDDKTFYKKIKKLKSSHNLIFNFALNDLKIYRYYNLEFNPDFGKFSEKKALNYSDELKRKIIDAVRLRLRSDVPIGTCLSGGIDSSAIFMIINKLLSSDETIDKKLIGKNQKAFTSCFKDKRFDESEYADIIVEKTNAEWYRVYPNSHELWNDFFGLVLQQDEPFRSTSIYAQYRVMKLAKEAGIKVILDGQGGDELFGGYGYHLESYLLDNFRFNRNPVIFIRELKKINKNSSVNSVKDLVRAFTMSLAKSYMPKRFLNLLNINRSAEFKYLNREFLSNYKNYDQGYSRIINKGLNNLLWQDMTSKNLQRLLKWEDLNSMAFSIESRTPFSDDHNLIEFVFSIPSCYKIHNGWMKWLFRKSLEGMVPEEVRLRKDKKGFVTSEKDWLIGGREIIKELFISKKGKTDEYFDTNKIIKNLDKILNYNINNEISDFWRFINLTAWIK